MSRLSPLAVFAALCLVAGCDVDPSPQVAAASAQSIAGASIDDVHAYVGAIVRIEPAEMPLAVLCSATLIDSRWALTSAGCLSALDDEDVTNLRVCMDGALSREGCGGVVIDRIYVHPDYAGTPGPSDAALLRLSPPVGITPAVLNPSSVAGYLGAELRLVGYGGGSPDAPEGVRGRGVTDVSAIDLEAIYIDDPVVGPCAGDVGGAGLLDIGGREVLAGIIAAGPEACVGLASLQRVDVIAPWVVATVANEAACDLFARTCPDAQACYPDGDDNACFESDQIRAGGACDPDASAWTRLPCDDGSMCLALPGSPDDGVCRSWCRSDADCDSDDAFLLCRVVFEGRDVRACMPVDDDGDGSWLPDDCDDTREDVYPDATEVCGNDVDEDCSGGIDDHPACAGGDAGPDAGTDAGSDVGTDVGLDAGGDAGTDAGGGPDAGDDVGDDVPSPDDAARDSDADTAVEDAPLDPGDTDASTPGDAGSDEARGSSGRGGCSAAGEAGATPTPWLAVVGLLAMVGLRRARPRGMGRAR